MKDYTKRQKILIVLGVSLFILTGSGLTYAALTWTTNPINIGLTSGCFEINYTQVGAMYDKERVSGTVVNATPTRTLTWTGKVAIPYPSDYGYAADLSLCQKQLASYNAATCTANNWMKNIVTNNSGNSGWLLTPYSGYAGGAWLVDSSGSIYDDYDYYVFNAFGVAPVLSLISELDIGSGSGTNSLPYQLSV